MNTKRRADCQLRHDWKERIIRIGDEQTSLQNQFDNFRNEYSDTHPRIEALEADVNALDGRLIIAESDIADAENRIAECESDIDSLEAEVDALDGRVTITESEISAAETRISACENDIESLETEVNALDGRVSITESDIVAAENRISTCESDIDSLESEVNSLDGRVSITESDIVTAKNRITACENDIDSLESEVSSLDGRVSIAESDISYAEDRISACEADIDRIDAELVDKTGDINALANRMSLAEADIDALDTRVDGIDADLADKTGKINNLTNRMSLAEADIDNLDARVSGIETGEILLSQLVVDADKDMGNKALTNLKYLEIKDCRLEVNTYSGHAGLRITNDLGNITLGARNAGHFHIDTTLPRFYIYKPLRVRGNVDVDGDADIGTATYKWRNGYFKGVLNAAGVVISDGGTVDGVDISTHTHDGTAVGGQKISYNDLVDKPDVAMATHNHDGTTVGGPKIDLKNVNITEDKSFNNTKITSLAGINDLVLSTTSVEEFIETKKDQLILTAGKDQSEPIGVVLRRYTLGPVLDNDGKIDLGRSTARFRDLYLSGDVKASTVNGINFSAKAAEWNGKARPPVPFYRDMIDVFLGSAGSYSFGTRMGPIVPPGRIGCTPFTLWMQISSILPRIDLRLEYVFDDNSVGRSDPLPTTEGQHHVELKHLLPTTDDYSTKNYIKDIRIRNLDIGHCTITASLKGFVY